MEQNTTINFVVAVILIIIPNTFSNKIDEDGYPDLQELFPAVPLPKVRRSPLGGKNFDLDIERIDVTKFKKKLERFAKTVTDNATITDARRQVLPYYSGRQFNRASKHLIRAKTLDLMLQTLYMARHSVQVLEGEKTFSKKDTGYRVAFIYGRLRRVWRKMMRVYTTMYNNWDSGGVNKNKKKYYRLEATMLLHMKAIQMHTDFLYLWKVLIGIDEKYTKRARVTTKKPKNIGKVAESTTMPASVGKSTPGV